MKTVKVMSIIGIVWFSFCFLLGVILLGSGDSDGAGGVAIWSTLYAIPFSIVTLVHSIKKKE